MPFFIPVIYETNMTTHKSNTEKKYSIIYADPPWSFNNKSTRASAEKHYSTMSIDELKALPVNNITAENAVLFMWFVPTMALEAIELAQAWGFKVKTLKGFTWVKLNKNHQKQLADGLVFNDGIEFTLTKMSFIGLGNYTRANTEDCLIAIKGKPLERKDKSIRQLVFSSIKKHSEKPFEVRNRINRLYGNVNKLEMFARDGDFLDEFMRKNWDVWGNECKNSITL